MHTAHRILVVDDDADILALMEGVISRNGMTAGTARSAAEAEAVLESFPADLIVLDLMMQGEDGLSFCRRLRARSNVPIIMLTALAEDVDRIVGLEIGADDYLGKPFNPRELVARIKSVLRRARDAKPIDDAGGNSDFAFGPFRLSPVQMSLAHQDGRSVHLTSGEFALLLALVERAPRVLSRDQLLDLSRGAVANPFDRSIDSQISRIRSKIEVDPRYPEYIKTVRNLGYAFAASVGRIRI
ncbi:response regulator [Aquisalinus flavus]|uniref:DNA-binding response regulator n=1 Tax=Aquisalinus flavus TaxID=1526572 RepID=A0A8J2Y3X9_9PROT|nr:response regulator [Aquisalinus flavus]MBD0426019.1 response regulator [Aquisalinus flavus]UNE48389.1 response regulator [Aquisalinus flavus]GGD11364.1 DNA-binding response regulator [Aquisalinus flavus]